MTKTKLRIDRNCFGPLRGKNDHCSKAWELTSSALIIVNGDDDDDAFVGFCCTYWMLLLMVLLDFIG